MTGVIERTRGATGRVVAGASLAALLLAGCSGPTRTDEVDRSGDAVAVQDAVPIVTDTDGGRNSMPVITVPTFGAGSAMPIVLQSNAPTSIAVIAASAYYVGDDGTTRTSPNGDDHEAIRWLRFDDTDGRYVLARVRTAANRTGTVRGVARIASVRSSAPTGAVYARVDLAYAPANGGSPTKPSPSDKEERAVWAFLIPVR